MHFGDCGHITQVDLKLVTKQLTFTIDDVTYIILVPLKHYFIRCVQKFIALKLENKCTVKIYLVFYLYNLALDNLQWLMCDKTKQNQNILSIYIDTQIKSSPFGWNCRIHQLHLWRGVRPSPMSVLIMILDHLIARLQSWSFGKCGVPLHCHYSYVHSDLEW